MCECTTITLKRIIVCLKEQNKPLCKSYITRITNSDIEKVGSGLDFLRKLKLINYTTVHSIKQYSLTQKGKEVKI